MPSERSIAEAYEILGLPEGVPLGKAEAAYRSLATQVHPDHFHNNPKMRSHAEDEQRKLNEAIRVLRVHWKASGGTGEGRPPHSEPAAPPPHSEPAAPPPRSEPPPRPAPWSDPVACPASPVQGLQVSLRRQLVVIFVVVFIVAKIGMYLLIHPDDDGRGSVNSPEYKKGQSAAAVSESAAQGKANAESKPDAPEPGQRPLGTAPEAPTPPVTQSAPMKAASPTSGALHATVELEHGQAVFENLPGERLKFTFDYEAWQPTIHRQPNGTQTLVMRSLRPGTNVQCDVRWEIIQ